MSLLLALSLGAWAQGEPPLAAPAVETSAEDPFEDPKPAKAGLELGDAERIALGELLAPLRDLRGETRRDRLAELMSQDHPAPVKAGLARALAESYDDEAPHGRIMAAALKAPAKAPTEEAKRPDQLDSAKLSSIREYQRRRLQIREETELRGGGSSVVSSPYSNPYTLGSSQVVTDPIYTVRSWGIYQGARRLTVPQYLNTIGSYEMQDYLEQDIRKLEATSKALYGLGAAGVLATVVGVVGVRNARDADQEIIFLATAAGGVGAMLGGFIGGSIPASKATRIETEPEFTFTPEQVRGDIDEHNDGLRKELDLSVQEVLLIEATSANGDVQPYLVPTGGRNSGLGLQFGVGGSF
jgi:hypothetical protein